MIIIPYYPHQGDERKKILQKEDNKGGINKK